MNTLRLMSHYAIAHVKLLSPGDEFVMKLRLYHSQPWPYALINKRYLKVSYQFGSNQGCWIERLLSRVKYDKHLR